MKIILTLLTSCICLAHSYGFAGVIHVPANYPTIQQGIDASSNGDTVLVADGVYSGNGNHDITFGGKAITVKSAGGAANTIIDCQGDQWNPRKGFVFVNEGRSTILDGFTVRNGSTGPYCLQFSGGAIYCEGSPTIKNCRFVDNTNRQNSCLYSGGGALFCFLGSPLVLNCIFENNDSDDFGGAVNIINAMPVFHNSVFMGNSSVWGGAIHSENSYPFLNGCIITGNVGDFGALYSPGSSEITIMNSTFAMNISDFSAIIQLTSSDIIHLASCILWDPSSPEIAADSASTVYVSYSDIMGGWSGVGNIDCDPLFCDPESGDFGLSAISCGAGTGQNGNNMGGAAVACGALGGVVTDQYGYPIPDVQVSILGAGLLIQTGGDGGYLFATVAPDIYDILFSHNQYRDSIVVNLAVPLGYTTQDISLEPSGPCSSYTVGDINGSGSFNGLDVTFGVSFFKGGAIPALECQCGAGESWYVAGDVNASCSYNGLDITYGVNFFKDGDGPTPCPDCPPE